MFMYTFNDQGGQSRTGKLPIVATLAKAKELLPTMLSGDSCKIFDPSKTVALDSGNTAFVSGTLYSACQMTVSDSEGRRRSFPVVLPESADEGATESAWATALLGKDMEGDGIATVTRVTLTVVATFTA